MKKFRIIPLLILIVVFFSSCSFSKSIYEDNYIKVYDVVSQFPIEGTNFCYIQFNIKNKSDKQINVEIVPSKIDCGELKKVFKNNMDNIEFDLVNISYDDIIDPGEKVEFSVTYFVSYGDKTYSIVSEIINTINKAINETDTVTFDFDISLTSEDGTFINQESVSVVL